MTTTTSQHVNMGNKGSVDYRIRMAHRDEYGLYTVACPKCLQQAGEPCVKPNTSRLLGRSARITHRERARAANDTNSLNADPRVHAVSVEDHDGEQVVFVYLADAWLYAGEGQYSASSVAVARLMLCDAEKVNQ